MKIVYIYSLTDPETEQMRYVGKSINLKKRFSQHLRRSPKRNHHCANWIKSLLKKNLQPKLDVIEEATEDNWKEREIYWIAFYRERYDLTNISEGGTGGATFGFQGKKHTSKTKLLCSKLRTGVSIQQNDNEGNRKRGIQEYYNKNKVAVFQYDLSGSFIREWESAVDAANELKIQHSNITKCCKMERNMTGGFRWKFKNLK
jgi:group I intron endonuclease